MKSPRLIAFLTSLLFTPCMPGFAQDTPLVLTVPPSTKVTVQIPAGWEKTVLQPAPDSMPTLRLVSPGKQVTIMFTFLPDKNGLLTTREKVNAAARGGDAMALEGSVEQKINLMETQSKYGIGAYAVFTDAKLAGVEKVPEGQFRVVAQGLYAMKGIGVALTVLGNDVKSAEFQRALKLMIDGISM